MVPENPQNVLCIQWKNPGLISLHKEFLQGVLHFLFIGPLKVIAVLCKSASLDTKCLGISVRAFFRRPIISIYFHYCCLTAIKAPQKFSFPSSLCRGHPLKFINIQGPPFSIPRQREKVSICSHHLSRCVLLPDTSSLRTAKFLGNSCLENRISNRTLKHLQYCNSFLLLNCEMAEQS